MAPNETNVENAPVLPEQETYAPDDIALALFGKDGAFQGGKRVRAYLRATYTRPPEQKGKSWTLAPKPARATFEHFLAMRTNEVVDGEPSDSSEAGSSD